MKLPATPAILLATAAAALAGREIRPPEAAPASPFAAGMREVQLGVGFNLSVHSASAARPALDDVGAAVRVGWMLHEPIFEDVLGGVIRGNFELLGEAGVSGVTRGPGNYLAGFSLLMRYNYLQPGWKLVPYGQFGGGIILSDAHQDGTQRLIGQAFEFNFQFAFGFRYLLSERTALYAEGGWRHISNAGLAARNAGLNSLGAQFGVSVFW